MEDLIPLIILVAISVIGMIGKKKQRKAAREQMSEEPERAEKDLFSWFDKINDEFIEPELQEEQSVTQTIVQESDLDIQKHKGGDNYQALSVKEKILNQYAAFSGTISDKEHKKIAADNRRGTLDRKPVKDVKKKEMIKAVDYRKPHLYFNLKQAVIYSELLNRKYN